MTDSRARRETEEKSQAAGDGPAEETREAWLERMRAEGGGAGWVERFRRLAEAIDASDEGEAADECLDVEPLLEMYVGSPLAMVDYEPLHQHLALCETCQEKMRSLQGMARDEGEPAAWGDEPAGEATALGGAWVVEPRAQVREPGPGFLVRFDPAFVASRLRQRRGAMVVRGAAEDGAVMLMADAVSVGEQSWLMAVRASGVMAEGGVTVWVTMTGDPVEAERCGAVDGLRVTLYWGEERREEEMGADGVARFEGLGAEVIGADAPRVGVEVLVAG